MENNQNIGNEDLKKSTLRNKKWPVFAWLCCVALLTVGTIAPDTQIVRAADTNNESTSNAAQTKVNNATRSIDPATVMDLNSLYSTTDGWKVTTYTVNDKITKSGIKFGSKTYSLVSYPIPYNTMDASKYPTDRPFLVT